MRVPTMEPQPHGNMTLRAHTTFFQKRSRGGYLTLLSVLIVAIFGAAVTFSSLLLGGNTARLALIQEQSFEARAFADACAELGLLAVTTAESFSGSDNITFSRGTCEYAVEPVSSRESEVTSTGYSGTVVRKVLVTATLEHTVTEMGTTTSIVSVLFEEPADF